MDDPRVRELAELMVNRCLDVQPGWQVSVRATPLARPLVREVAGAIARRGAYYLPRINWGPERFRADLDWALEAPLELLGELPAIEAYQVANEDARLTIRAPEDVYAASQLDPERRKLLQQAGEPASRRARALDVRWALVEYPTEAAAAEAGMTLPEYEEFVYDACLLDWDAEEERMGQIKERFDRGRSVHIVGADTDLTLGIEGREGVVSAGFRNMPDGEVFYSPVEDSAEGVITYAEFPAVYLGHDVVGARLVFREGKVVEASADEGEEFLKQILATDEGAQPARRARARLQPADHDVHAQRPLRREDRRHRPPRRRRELHVHGRHERERRPLGHGQGPASRRRDLGRRRARPARRRLADLSAK